MLYKFLDRSKLSFGDIVIAKRSWSNLKTGHEFSPHIVINNDGNNLYLIIGTSSHNDNSYFFEHVQFYKGKKRISYYIPRIYKVPYHRVLEKIDSCSEEEKVFITKALHSSSYNCYKNELPPDLPLDAGDIIIYKKDDVFIKKVIAEICDGKYYCLNVRNQGKKYDNRHVIDYSHVCVYDNLDHFEENRYDILSRVELQNMLNNFKRILITNMTKAISVGDIVYFKDKFLYVSETNEKTTKGYLVRIDLRGQSVILLNDVCFSIDFNDVCAYPTSVLKDRVVYSTSDLERDNIEINRRIFVRERKKERNNRSEK